MSRWTITTMPFCKALSKLPLKWAFPPCSRTSPPAFLRLWASQKRSLTNTSPVPFHVWAALASTKLHSWLTATIRVRLTRWALAPTLRLTRWAPTRRARGTKTTCTTRKPFICCKRPLVAVITSYLNSTPRWWTTKTARTRCAACWKCSTATPRCRWKKWKAWTRSSNVLKPAR